MAKPRSDTQRCRPEQSALDGGNTVGRAARFSSARSLRRVAIAALCLLATEVLPAEPPASAPDAPRFAKGRLLVQPRAGLSDHQFDLILKPHLGRRIGRNAQLNLHVIELPAGVDEAALARILRKNPHIKFAELDRERPPALSPNDPTYPSEWHEAMIRAPAAWDYSTGQGVTIAILDSGVDSTHPDLTNALVPGWNFFDGNSNTSDVYGHGTKVAGAAAASGNNGVGVAGVAWNSKIMPIRVTDTSGSAYDSMLVQGLTWAADHGARVANMSFLGVTESAAVVSAAQYMRSKGGVVVAAGGNTGLFETSPQTDAITSVSGTDSTDARPSWSSYGNYIDVAAPGAGIYSTVSGGTYASVSGTSFSAPITAGVYALMVSANPSLTPSMLDNALFTTTVDKGVSGWDQYYGWGRIDAFAAVTKARATVVGDTRAPTVAITSPVSGTVQGLVAVDVTATDNIGVTRVELWVNGALYAGDVTSPFGFTWDTTTLANGAYSLQAVAYDAAGNQGSSSTITLTVANGGSLTGSLTGAGIVSGATVNLTSVGTLDWAKWPNYVHKATGGAQISTYAVVGTSGAQSYTNDPRTVSWSDGVPTASGSDSAGISTAGIGNGFNITTPADTTTRTLNVYVGGTSSSGKLVAHLSDGSAPDYIDSAISGTSQYDAVYTLTYRAASAGQQLVVSWTQASGSGNVTLQGVALAPGTSAPLAPTGVAATDGTSTSSVTVTWTASANATSYTVYRSTATGTLGASVGTTTTTSLTDSTVVPGTVYYYAVRATGVGGTSAASAQNSGYAAAPPPAPTGVAASDGTSATSVTVTWTASANATSYTVYRSATSGHIGPASRESDQNDQLDRFHRRARHRVLLLRGGYGGGGYQCGECAEQRLCRPAPADLSTEWHDPAGQSPLSAVSVSATGGVTCTASNTSGVYSCSVPRGWSGTVTPALAGYTFTPASRSYSSVAANQTCAGLRCGGPRHRHGHGVGGRCRLSHRGPRWRGRMDLGEQQPGAVSRERWAYQSAVRAGRINSYFCRTPAPR